MQLKEFCELEQIAQQEIVLDDGVYLSSRLYLDYTVLLFQLNSFYAELFYPKNKDKCVIIKGFEDTQELEPYLQRINISPLLANI